MGTESKVCLAPWQGNFIARIPIPPAQFGLPVLSHPGKLIVVVRLDRVERRLALDYESIYLHRERHDFGSPYLFRFHPH